MRLPGKKLRNSNPGVDSDKKKSALGRIRREGKGAQGEGTLRTDGKKKCSRRPHRRIPVVTERACGKRKR